MSAPISHSSFVSAQTEAIRFWSRNAKVADLISGVTFEVDESLADEPGRGRRYWITFEQDVDRYEIHETDPFA